jgi:hypothetical protein
MKFRSGALVSVLGALVLMGMVGGYLLMQGKDRASDAPAIPTRHTAWADDDDEFDFQRTAREDDKAGTQATFEPGSREDDTGTGSSGGTSASGDGPPDHGDGGFVLDDADIPSINPEEIEEPVPGHLLVRVLSREDDRPLPGASVYFPIRGSTLTSVGGEVRVSNRLDITQRRTNRHGVAVWNQMELREMLEAQQDRAGESTSILATALGYAEVFEPMNIPDLNRGAMVTFRLFPAVRVTGRVRVHRGNVVGDAQVDILQTSRQGDSETPVNRFRITADAMGEFSVRLAESYLYVFEVKHTGFANYRSRVFNFREDRREVSILLEPAQGVSGVVVSDTGSPVEGAEVWNRSDDERVTTDAQGQFAFARVRDRIFSNDVNLRVTAEGFAPRNHTALANDDNIRIRLEPEGTIRGVVHGPSGEPVAGATVRCDYHEGRQRYPLEPVTTDADGEFLLRGFGAGRASLTATHGDLYSRGTEVDMRPGRDAGPVTLRLVTGATIRGHVTAQGAPIAGVTVLLDGKPAGATGSDGGYVLSGVGEGTHHVRIQNDFPVSNEVLQRLPIFTVDGENWFYLPSEREVVTNLGDEAEVNFEVEPFDADIDRNITLRVATQPSESTQGVQVTINPVFGTPPEGVEAPSTVTASLDLPDGRASMPLSLVNGVRYEVSFQHNQYFPVTLTPEELDAVADEGTLDVTLERAFLLKGYVRDSDGNGIESVRVQRSGGGSDVTTDVYGYFEFGELQAGDYTITAFRQGYYREDVETTVGPGDPDQLDIVMVNANEIRIIVNNFGVAQPGAHVHIYRHDAEEQDPDQYMRHFDIGTTDARGEKYVNFHWIRNYQIVAYYNNRVAFVNFNNLLEVPEREFTIELEPSYVLSGTVMDETTQQPLAGVYIRAHIASTGVDGRDGNFFQLQSNGSGNFEFRVPAGDYHFYLPRTRSHEGHSTESNRVPAGTTGIQLMVPMRDDVQGNYAQVLGISAPQTMVAGQSYEVSVTVRNMGNTTWTGEGGQRYQLGSENPRNNETWGRTRVNVPGGVSVSPNSVYVFTFNVTAPSEPGTYNMQWQMLQRRVEWFGTRSPTHQITVTPGE